MANRSETLPLGVLVERRKIDHPWQEYSWRPAAVLLGAAPVAPWTLVREEGSVALYHAATLPLEVHRADTEAYRTNLEASAPVVYVVLRPDEGTRGNFPFRPFLVTVSPFEAQDYADSGEDLVEGVSMPDPLLAWLRDFVAKHHVEEPFQKRRRRPPEAPDETFAGRPRVSRTRRRRLG